MDNRPVLFIDSGIGGLFYCMDFIKNNPHEDVFYLADRKNFPYGQKEKETLSSILTFLIEGIIKKINPKLIVLACNSATTGAISSLRERFPQIQFVGTVPAIKPAAIACNNGKVGVLATARTIEDIPNLGIIDNECKIFGIAAPELADFIEMHFDSTGETEKKEIAKKYIELFRAEKVDTLVLGCTHFLFLLEEFRIAAKPYFEVFESLSGITKRIEYLLDENDGTLRAKKDSDAEYRLFVSGGRQDETLWNERAKKFGFNLFFYDELQVTHGNT